MDLRQLLETLDQFAGEKPQQKLGEDSILKDLSKGKTPKTREQELAEEYQQFLNQIEEENLGTHPKRAGRQGGRHPRGHEPKSGYNTVKADTKEGIDSDIVQPIGQDSFNRGGFNPLRDKRDYLDKLSQLRNLALKPGINKQMQDQITQRVNDLNAEARKKGYIQAESRGHKVIDTFFKNREIAQRAFTGQNKKPQEKKPEEPKKQVKEYGANATSPYGQSATDPKQAAQIAQATQTLKAATGSTAPTTNITKALDAASQGKPVGQADMKTLEPMMKDIATVAQDPKLAGQFKTLAQQIQQKQQQAPKTT